MNFDSMTPEDARAISLEHLSCNTPPKEFQLEINRRITQAASNGLFGFMLHNMTNAEKTFMETLIFYREFYRKLGFSVDIREYEETIIFSWRNV